MRLLLITLLLGLFLTPTFGQVPQKIEGTRIQDFAQLLSPEQEAQLQAKTDQLKASKDIELGIILVNSTDGVAPVDYTTNIGRQFGIGSAEGEHRGIVFLLAISDRQCFIQPSRHISGTYTDGQMASICRSMRPQLRAQDYNAALNNGADQLISLATGVDSQQMQGIASDTQPVTSNSGGGGFILLVLGIIVLVGGAGIAIAVAISKHREREEREAEAEARRLRQEALRKLQEKQEALRKLQEKKEMEEREAHEAWLKTPEGIADTERKRKAAEEAEKLRIQREKEAQAERDRKAREYAIWAATPAGIAALALEAEQRRKREQQAEQERKARQKREEEAEEERKRRRRQQEEDDDRRRRSSSSSSSSWGSGWSSSSSSSNSSSSSGFGGGSDFGGGGGGDSW